MRYREASVELWKLFTPIMDCLAKSCPACSSYLSLKEFCLIVTENYSGVRPVRIGDIWQIFFAKYIFAVVGVEAKEA